MSISQGDNAVPPLRLNQLSLDQESSTLQKLLSHCTLSLVYMFKCTRFLFIKVPHGTTVDFTCLEDMYAEENMTTCENGDWTDKFSECTGRNIKFDSSYLLSNIFIFILNILI